MLVVKTICTTKNRYMIKRRDSHYIRSEFDPETAILVITFFHTSGHEQCTIHDV